MLRKHRSARNFGARAGALAGLGLMGCGVLLLVLAFSGDVFGRIVTYAWVAGIAGLSLLFPGAALACHAVWRLFNPPPDE